MWAKWVLQSCSRQPAIHLLRSAPTTAALSQQNTPTLHRPASIWSPAGLGSESRSLHPARLACSAAAPDSMSTSACPRVAVGQMTATGSQEHNLATNEALCKEARAQDCCMLFLPECFSFIGLNQDESRAAAQPLDGSLMQQYCAMAKRHSLWLSLGGFQEVGPDPEHIFNCHVVVNEAGSIVSTYRKVHLFNVSVHNGPVLMEGRGTAPGQQLEACDSPAGRLGLTVCYDLRFPEVYQRLAFDLGAKVLLVPSAFTKATGKVHWELLLRARAVETQCFVIAAAQAGQHNAKRESYGHSIIVDPWGEVIAKLEDPEATGIAVADLDMGYLEKVRERMPMAQHRRQGRVCMGWDQPSHEEQTSGVLPGVA